MPDLYVGDQKNPDEKPEETLNDKIDSPLIDEPKPEDQPPAEPTPEPPSNPSQNPSSEKHHHAHIFSSYCPNPPKEVVFANREENEVLLLFLRRHLITNLPWILKALLFMSVPIIFEILNNYGLISITFLTTTQQIIIGGFYYFAVFSAYIFVNYITWFYNISLVTNERVVDIDFSNIVFEDVSATKLSQVEDVHYSQVGLSRSVFDYGDVLVQTAATTNEFQFNSVPHPEKIIKIINDLIGGEANA